MKASWIFICRVSNVTHFGAFVDVGLGKVIIINRIYQLFIKIFTVNMSICPSLQNGLIHSSKMGKVVGKLEVKNTNLVHFVYSWLMVLSNIPGWRPGGGQSSKYWYCQRKNRAWSFENNIEVCQTDFFPFFYQTWVNDSISWPLVDFKIKLFFFSLLILQRDARDRKCSPVPVSLCQICQILSWYRQKKV